ncbi:MAG: peptidyl-prolyl cis-trans isomerase [Armatimonadota bacterium]|nr:MAG: peptidyl-prolyl cis-trans isomerase [Armatimonadota bacterium]
MSATHKWRLVSLILFLLSLALAASTIALGRAYYRAWLRPAAVVEGHKIPIRDLYGRLREQHGRDQLAKMVTEVYIPIAAARANVTATEDEIDQKIAALKLRWGTDEEFESFLRYGLRIDPAQLRDQVKLLILGEKFMLASTPIGEQEVRAYWEEHRDEFRHPELFRVLKMTLGSESEAREVREQLAQGADFSAIAADKSYDPYTKMMRGRLPKPVPLTEFSTDPRYKEVFADLKPGEVTPPMQANFGIMLVKLLERIPPHEPDYEADRADAEERARRRKIGDPNAWMLRHLKQANVENLLFGSDWDVGPAGPVPGAAGPQMGE